MPNHGSFEVHHFAIGVAWALTALHVAFSAIFAAACLLIAAVWLSFARSRPELRLGPVLYAVVPLILACGIMRLMSISTPWLSPAGPEWAMEAVTTCLTILASVMLWRGARVRISDEVAARLDRKRQAIDLLQSEAVKTKLDNERMHRLLDSAMDAWIAIDDQHNIVLFNKAAAEMFEVDVADAMGSSVNRFIPEPFRAGHADQVRGFSQTPSANRRMIASPSISLVRASGERFAAEAAISHVEVGGRMFASVVMRDVTERQAAEATRRLLAEEVDHRAKNSLAIVQAVVSMTHAPTKEAFVESVLGRISALAHAQKILAENRWQGGDLFRIIADETSPYEKPGQIRMLGSSVTVSLNAVQPISMIVHELATNAVKYGALSVDEGQVDIAVRILQGGELQLSWTERGGPAVAPPARTGFGTTLITQIANRQLKGAIDVSWPVTGLRLVTTLPPSTHGSAYAYPLLARPDLDPTVDANRIAGGKVLVVEDELLTSAALCDGLRAIGWEIVGPAKTVGDGLRLIDITSKIDVAILDINLGGEFVYPVAERLRSLGVPFVYCTGDEQKSHESRRTEDPIIHKPVNMGLMNRRLRALKSAA